ncbi:MAG: hypothetical protein WCV41_03025 [Patescibacteria group bacterium]
MKKKLDWKAMGQFCAVLLNVFAIIRSTFEQMKIGIEIIPWLTGDGKKFFVEEFLKPLGNKFVTAPQNIFNLVIKSGRATEEVISAGKYDWVNEYITSQNFPLRLQQDGEVAIELLKFDHNVSSEEVIEEARKRGLERPTYETALFFGEQHPEEQRKHPIVFLHEPWQSPGSRGRVLVLYSSSPGRILDLLWFCSCWDRDYMFAFVRK